MKQNMLKKLLAVAVVGTMMAGLVACGGGSSAPAAAPAEEEAAEEEAPAEEEAAPEAEAPAEEAPAADAVDPASLEASLYLYTSEPEALVSDMIAKFNETYPNIEITLNRAGTGKITAQLDTELAAGGTDANILWFADIGYMNDLDQKGMVEHYVSPNAAEVDPQYLYGDGLGGEVRLIYNVIAYNTDLITEAPKDWADVATEPFKDKFAIADPNISGGSATALIVLNQNTGWDWYESIAANGMKYETANGALQEKVASGEYAGVQIVDFMARTSREEGSPVDVCYPESGAILVPTPLTLLNNMDEAQMAAAKAFVDWCYTPEAQEMLVAQQYIPVVPGVEGPANCPKAEEIKTMPFDLQFYLDNKASILEEYSTRFGGAEQ